ncbi:MAG: sugar phosphate isomerase/epimerase [Kiritimatiellae bacterium]|nr:sugar phosphate isomerase/epimerase [Kiritimatiellia bacterium]
MDTLNRRNFIGIAAAAAATTAAADCCKAKKCCKGRILFGACRGPNDTPMMKKLGYDFFEWNVASAMMPDKSEAEWAPTRDKVLGAALPIRSCNGFLPGKFRLTGPNAKWDEALDYAETACRRGDVLGVKTIVFGSSGARNVPGDLLAEKKEGRPDAEKGVEQYTEFCRLLCKRIADCKVTVVIEPLRQNESNIINFVWQGLQIVEDVGSPRLQQLADIFHMLCGRESARSLIEAGPRLKHCHIAAKVTRQFPGSNDTDFAPYFNALKLIGYTGGVSCECGWGNKQDLEKNMATALATLKGFAGQA